MTGADLAHRLDVSSRTVRADIKYLQECLAKSCCTLLAIPNRGYKLQGAEYGEDLLRLVDGNNAAVGVLHPKERQNYIVSRFLECCLTNASVTQMSLADEMYIGLSTVKNYLTAVRERFAAYDLKIVQYKAEGMKLCDIGARDEHTISKSFSIRRKGCVSKVRREICVPLLSIICMK